MFSGSWVGTGWPTDLGPSELIVRLEMHLAAVPSSVPAVRLALEDALTSLASTQTIDDVRLLASEVTANAVRHAGVRGHSLDVVLDVDRGVIRVEVVDGGVGFEPPRPPRIEREVGGYGLFLVEALSDRWGTLTSPRFGVWFERAVDPR